MRSHRAQLLTGAGIAGATSAAFKIASNRSGADDDAHDFCRGASCSSLTLAALSPCDEYILRQATFNSHFLPRIALKPESPNIVLRRLQVNLIYYYWCY